MRKVTITMNWYQKDFFGNRRFTEDTFTAYDTKNATSAAMAAFRAVFKDTGKGMKIHDNTDDGCLVIWREYEDIADPDNDTVTLRIYSQLHTYDEYRVNKKLALSTIKSWCEIFE